MDTQLRSRLIRLAKAKPELRSHLLPLLQKTATAYGTGPNGYIAFYRGKKVEVKAKTTYEAQQIAARVLKARRPGEVTVMLAEKGGRSVIHDPSILASRQAASTKYLTTYSVALAKRVGKTRSPVMIFMALQQVLNEYLSIMLNRNLLLDPKLGASIEVLLKKIAILVARTRADYDAEARVSPPVQSPEEQAESAIYWPE